MNGNTGISASEQLKAGSARKSGIGPNVLCVLPRRRDSRIARRIDMLRGAGFGVTAVSFAREQDTGREPDCPVLSLGAIRHGKYLARVPRMLGAIPAVRRAIGLADIVYAFNADLALLSLAAGAGLRRPTVLETADIRAVQVAGSVNGRALRALEKTVIGRCSLLVLTSEGYRTYYDDWLGTQKDTLVIENKVVASAALFAGKHRIGRSEIAHKIRIGWFGMLRDEWSWEVLARLIADRPQRFSAVLAGVGMLDNFHGRVAGHPEARYLGEYTNPTGLQRIYSQVDVVLACYSPEIPHGWSQSNRYYEACLFGKPLIVRAGCADAERVREFDIGLVIDGADRQDAASAIDAVTREDLARWGRNIRRLPVEAYAVTDEPSRLCNALTGIVEGQARHANPDDSEKHQEIWKNLW